MKLLLIEDDNTTIKILSKIFVGLEIKFDYAQTGSDSINYYRSKQYDVVIVDLKFPGKDVFEILLELNLTSPNSKIIIYTSSLDLETKELLSSYDLYDVILKEAGHAKLIDKVKKIQSTINF